MADPTHWDQSAWSLALTMVSLLVSSAAFWRTRSVKKRVAESLVRTRLVGVLADLQAAGESLNAASNKGTFELACAQWRKLSPLVEQLQEHSGNKHQNPALNQVLWLIHPMIATSFDEIASGTKVPVAKRLLSRTVNDATTQARKYRVTLESEAPK